MTDEIINYFFIEKIGSISIILLDFFSQEHDDRHYQNLLTLSPLSRTR
ncbi:hypothetical protein [Ornithinibacillus scapharcae]|nr:hypothetical protein [Ornithinibacillus scapharcae]